MLQRYYVVRESKYGIFGGCSNYPKCKSTKKMEDMVLQFLKTYGLGIYCWNKICWKCGKSTPVYSYYLNYDLLEADDSFDLSGMGGIGEINTFDKILMSRYSCVKEQFSKTLEHNYVANICEHCKALQGHNYVVDDPHEIFDELYFSHKMDKFLIQRIYKFNNEESLKRELKLYFDNMFDYEN